MPNRVELFVKSECLPAEPTRIHSQLLKMIVAERKVFKKTYETHHN